MLEFWTGDWAWEARLEVGVGLRRERGGVGTG